MSIADPTQLKIRKNLQFDGIFFCLARPPQTERLFCGRSDFSVCEIDTSAEKPKPVAFSGEAHQSYVSGMALLEDHILVSGGYDGRLIWWDTEKRESIRSVAAHQNWIRRVTATPDQKLVASVADDMVCRLWDAESGRLISELKEHKPTTPHHYPSMLYALTFSTDGKLMATGDKVGHVAIWEVANGHKIAELETPVMYTWDPVQRRHSIGGIRSLAFSHDTKRLAVGGIGKIGNIDHLGGPSRIEVFDWASGTRIHELEDNKLKGLVEQIAFDPSGKWFVAAGGDHNGFVSFYEVDSGKLIHQDKAPMHVHGFVLSESFDTLYGAGHGRIAIWTLDSPEPKA